MTKIGTLIPEFPGQTHAFFWREMEAMEEAGAKVELISTRRPVAHLISHDWSQDAIARTTYLTFIGPSALISSLPAMSSVLRDGIGPRAIASERKWFLKTAPLHLPFAQNLNRIARARGLAHIHVHSCARSALIAMLARRLGGPSYSLTLHGPLRDYGPGQLYKWRDAAFVTVITNKLLGEVQGTLTGIDLPPILVQSMGVDTDRFSRQEPYTPPTPGETVRIFSCGRLNRVKGHDTLIAAVGQLARAGIDARLDIAGEDEQGGTGYRGTLETLIREEDLSDRVRLLGAIDGGAVRDRLRAAHVFALASHSEPLGVAYMEAMACEVPVIGTDAGGVRELIDDGHDGLLVPPRDVDALTAAISGILQDPERAAAMGRAGREKIVSAFSTRIGAHNLLDAIATYGDPGNPGRSGRVSKQD